MPEYDLAIDTVVTPMTSECEALNISYVETEDGVMDRGCFEDGYLESGNIQLHINTDSQTNMSQ